MPQTMPSHAEAGSVTKAKIVAIEKTPQHRAELTAVLSGLYDFEAHESANRALSSLMLSPPALLLLASNAADQGLPHIIKVLRENRTTQKLPIIITGGSEVSSAMLKALPVEGFLAKPFRRSVLFRVISQILSRKVEESWQALPPQPREALQRTVAVFNQVSDIIAQGKPVEYQQVGDACAPLVEAVNSGDYRGILSGVKGHDNYSYVHSMRVATLLSLFGHAIGLPKDQQLVLASGGLLHDVGKVTIPPDVLNKPGQLNDEDWKVMRGHVHASVEYLQNCGDLPRGVVIIAAQHHEKLDGSGYPVGLRGRQLNTLTRMVAIVDIFAGLTDHRVYRPALQPEPALTLMADQMGAMVDQPLLGKFRQMLLDSASGMG